MIRALLIDAVEREVREVELPDGANERLAEMSRLIGGYLETAYMWPTGDVLFVDEDGQRHDWPHGFRFGTRYSQQVIGNGIVVGREVEGDQYPDGWMHLDPRITADELCRLVRFFTRGRGDMY